MRNNKSKIQSLNANRAHKMMRLGFWVPLMGLAFLIVFQFKEFLALRTALVSDALVGRDDSETETESTTTSYAWSPRHVLTSSAIDSSNSRGSNDTKASIRQWGCSITQTPFVFLHLGKMGGGSIRRRLAAGAYGYQKSKDWNANRPKDQQFFPIRNSNGTVVRKACYCEAGHQNFLPVTFRLPEGVSLCTASTPLGQAVACPATHRHTRCFFPEDANSQSRKAMTSHPYDMADIMTGGHVPFGNEIHWLPAAYLQQWWKDQQIFWSRKKRQQPSPSNGWRWMSWLYGSDSKSEGAREKDRDNTKMDGYWESKWQSLDGVHTWCDSGDMNIVRPALGNAVPNQARVKSCRLDLEASVDKAAWAHLSKLYSDESDIFVDLSKPSVARGQVFSALYSSLPVTRVVMMRNIFTWLTSKFAWHSLHTTKIKCDDIAEATAGAGTSNYARNKQAPPATSDQPMRSEDYYMYGWFDPGWAKRFCVWCIYMLCGSDCAVRHWKGESTLEELVAQSEANLRNAFVVVGILEHGQEEFFDLINKRVDYVNLMTNETIANTAGGGNHGTPSRGEAGRCKERFKDPEFQRQLMEASPEVSAMVHLYNVALEVNAFQKEELSQCTPRPKYNGE